MNVRALTLTTVIAAMVAVPALSRVRAQESKPDWREMNA